MLAGLDISINGSGCAFDNGNFYFQTPLKKLPKSLNYKNISGDTAIGFNKLGNEERYYNNAVKIVNKCLENFVTSVVIESYAYGYGHESPGRVFDIAEFTGVVKCLLIQNNIKIYKYAPKEIKKYATGNGNSTKIKLVEKYFELNPNSELLQFIEDYKLNRYNSPINDLIDAYWILQKFISSFKDI